MVLYLEWAAWIVDWIFIREVRGVVVVLMGLWEAEGQRWDSQKKEERVIRSLEEIVRRGV